MPNKHTFLDLSTGHLSRAAKRWLDEGAELNMMGSQEKGPGAAMGCLGATLYGWFMTTSNDGVKDYGMPPELAAICVFAEERGCHYILFDADADEEPDLPVYDDFGDVPRKSEARHDDWSATEKPINVETPPQNVYYHDGNFYSTETRNGMGEEFYIKWRDRASEFRSRPDRIVIATGEDSSSVSLKEFENADKVVSVSGRVLKNRYGPIDAGIADELAEPGELDITAEKLERLMGDMVKMMHPEPAEVIGDLEAVNLNHLIGGSGKLGTMHVEPETEIPAIYRAPNIAYGGKIDDYLAAARRDEVVVVSGRPVLTAKGIITALQQSKVDDGLISIIAGRLADNAKNRYEQRRREKAAMAELKAACDSILEDVEAEIEERQAGMDEALWKGLRAKADRLASSIYKVYR